MHSCKCHLLSVVKTCNICNIYAFKVALIKVLCLADLTELLFAEISNIAPSKKRIFFLRCKYWDDIYHQRLAGNTVLHQTLVNQSVR